MAFHPEDVAQRYLGPRAAQRRTPQAGSSDPSQAIQTVQSQFPREALRDTLSAAGLPDPMLGQIGLTSSATGITNEFPTGDMLMSNTGMSSGGIENNQATTPLSEQIITGSYFNFPKQPDNYGDLWGNIGEGPEGYNWNANGSPLYNPYIPAYFGDDRKPVLNFPPLFTRQEFEQRHLLGFEPILAQWPNWNDVFHTFYTQAIDATEQAFGGVIYPRIILTDGLNRGFIPGQDYDWDER